MQEEKQQADKSATAAAAAKKIMNHVGGLAYELNRAEYGINSAIGRCRALHLVDVESELLALSRRLERITASIQPAIFVELSGLINDSDA
jgi:hypothetical protein